MICSRCHTPIIGEGRRFYNEETDMVYHQHETCWRKTYYEALYAVSVIIRRAKEGGENEVSS